MVKLFLCAAILGLAAPVKAQVPDGGGRPQTESLPTRPPSVSTTTPPGLTASALFLSRAGPARPSDGAAPPSFRALSQHFPSSPRGLDGIFDGSAAAGEAVPVAVARPPEKRKSPWTLRVTFGPSTTQYFKSSIRIKTSEITGTFRQVQPQERNSMEYYQVWAENNPFQFIDEPTNTITFSAENRRKNYALNLVYFHPKFLLAYPDGNTKVPFAGTIQGQAVTGSQNINKLFSTYQLTEGQVDIQAQFQKIITLVKSRNAGTLEYRPGVGLGMILGAPYETYLKKNGQGQDSYTGTLAPTGASVTISNALTYFFPGDRINVSLAHSFSAGRMYYAMLDGTAQQDLLYQNVTLNAGVRIARINKSQK